MPTVSGSLLFVSSRAAQVSEVWVRAPRVRTHAEGVVTTGNDRFPVKDGEVSFTAVPGPAVLALISQGRAVDTIPIVVGDAGTQTLRQVVSAAKIADDATQREIEKLSAQAIHLVDSSTENARKAQDGATRAETAAGEAKSSAASAATSEKNAGESATQSEASARRSESSAGAAASSESAAAESAEEAKSHADRAEAIPDATSWDGDRLTVNGKTSPSLTGPKGEPGKSGASTWDEVQNKPDKFPPEGHTHLSADITDTTNDAGSGEFGGKVLTPRAKDGKIFYYSNPTEYRELARKGYVDGEVAKKADKSHTHSRRDIRDLPSIAETIVEGSIPVRGSTGTFYVSPPEFAGHVANKKYVDEQVGGLRDRVGALESGGSSSVWTGSKAEYDQISPKNPDTIYIVR